MAFITQLECIVFIIFGGSVLEPPLYCESQIIREMTQAWAGSKNGYENSEYGFITYKSNNGNNGVVKIPITYENKVLNFNLSKLLPEGAILTSIFHTHPSCLDPTPSKIDKQTSHRLGVPIYVISKHGLNVFDPHTGKTIEVRKFIEWTKPC